MKKNWLEVGIKDSRKHERKIERIFSPQHAYNPVWYGETTISFLNMEFLNSVASVLVNKTI